MYGQRVTQLAGPPPSNPMRLGDRSRVVTIGATLVIALGGCGVEERIESDTRAVQAPGPLAAVYEIEGESIGLRGGYYETPAAPGSAAKITVAIHDSPAYGHLNDDELADAAVILVYRGGGSGTFYYVAAAINTGDSYRGTNSVFLGDRIIPEATRIENRNIVVDFADRSPDAAMAAVPTLHVTDYANLQGAELVVMPREQEMPGWVTLGHEVRSFQPCDADAEHWLLSRSPALSNVEKRYREMTPARPPYTPVFMQLTGSLTDAPNAGFGRDYAAGFFVTGLISADGSGHCREDSIVVEEPLAGTVIEAPLAIRGRARGSWFFEGDFPVVLQDQGGASIATGFVVAQGEWMTKEFVPFAGQLPFTGPPGGGRGRLVFRKDNPSEQRELDDEMSIPVFFREIENQ